MTEDIARFQEIVSQVRVETGEVRHKWVGGVLTIYVDARILSGEKSVSKTLRVRVEEVKAGHEDNEYRKEVRKAIMYLAFGTTNVHLHDGGNRKQWLDFMTGKLSGKVMQRARVYSRRKDVVDETNRRWNAEKRELRKKRLSSLVAAMVREMPKLTERELTEAFRKAKADATVSAVMES